MVIRTKLPSVLLLFCLVLLCGTLVLGTRDPELKQCKYQCRHQGQHGSRQIHECEAKCEKYQKEKERTEGGGGQGNLVLNAQDPKEKLQQCERRCSEQHQQEEEQAQCRQQCQEEFQQEQEGKQGGEGTGDTKDPYDKKRAEESEEEEEKGQQGEGKRGEGSEEEEEEEGKEGRGRGRGQEGSEEEEEEEEESKKGRGRGRKEESEEEEEEESEKGRGRGRGRGRGKRQEGSEEEEEEEEEEESEEGRGSKRHEESEEEEEEESEGRRRRKNPYVFEDEHFITKFETKHGQVKTIETFTDRDSAGLLQVLEKFSLSILSADPLTFMSPAYFDAELTLFVARGRGAISLVHQDKRESFNLRFGDVLVIPAGTTIYSINPDKNKKFVVIKLLKAVSSPRVETFFGAGGENPETFLNVFSPELVEASLGVKRDRFQGVLKQTKGPIMKISQEQSRSMSHHEEGRRWPFGAESKGPCNLFDERPTYANQYGQLYQVEPSECRDLQQLNLAVGLVNLTRGSQTVIEMDSTATKILIGLKGEGGFQMACPHLSSSSRSRSRSRKTGPRFQKVSATLRRGVVVVVPAGHPAITFASKKKNLQVLCFEVNAQNNRRIAFAGRRNVFKQLEKQAMQLGFGAPAREVSEVFSSQDEEGFVPSRLQQGSGGRAFA